MGIYGLPEGMTWRVSVVVNMVELFVARLLYLLELYIYISSRRLPNMPVHSLRPFGPFT
jgi:hypothetical protein